MGLPQASDMAQTNGGQTSLAKDLFADMGRQAEQLSANDDQKVVEEIESLCMNCHEDGVTRLLLTKIPFFREIVIMSFSCEKCGFHNNEIQSAGEIQPKGAKYALRVEKNEDLERNVVKSDVCAFRIEDIDLEIPPGKGQYSNVEGIIRAVKDDLESHQDERMRQMPEVGAKVGEIIRSIEDMLNGQKYPFMISVDDPTGNSTIEPKPGDAAGKWAKSEYIRTAAQNATLGLGDDVPAPESQAPETALRPEYHAQGLVGADASAAPQGNNVDQEDDIVENQVYSFPASCPGCTRPCATNMKMVNIPFFKQVVLMSTVCEHCGYRSNEVKTGGAVPEKGRKITLKVSTKEDLARDILKSESAALSCPELQLRVEPGTMGGRFTTVEGIMTNIRKDLRAQAFGLEDGDAELPEGAGDSMATDSKKQWDNFFELLTQAIEGQKEFTLVLEDPLAGSYVQSLTAPEPDPKLELQDYTRTAEEEEDLGLNDIKTEGYEQDEQETTS
ncbi:Putative Zinc finger, ZPR1-type, ZPR1, A/B domain, ZPR1, zinc finger domain-containing protein [Septoria linicola]|uniref:Zinc finger, ZPR1-type, ZPR1, A/B domain, ZPR1, zinc finger domain-containing protein n=1 Tax=Septoria linicola TaxID=215465 RepID=A0A9Q9B5G3_9PEZI|nr:Putative Zinc finger, ZPR1-type, ZPR1, A/B domain, ZPR1, zinc finger domain-containing protein [Septoria linicola]